MLLNPVVEKRHRDLLKINGYLTIGDAAKFLGVSVQTLRYWDKKKKIVSSRNPINDWRLYRIADLQNILDDIQLSGLKSAAEKI